VFIAPAQRARDDGARKGYAGMNRLEGVPDTRAANSRRGTRDAALTRERLLDAAASELARSGFGGTSLRTVARLAGVQLGSFYFHFSSKDELVLEVLREGISLGLERIHEEISRLPTDATAFDEVAAMMRAHSDVIRERHDRASAAVIVQGTLPDELKAETHAIRETYSQLWTERIERAQKEGSMRADVPPESMRIVILSTLNSVLSVRSERTRKARADDLISSLLLMLSR